MIQKANLEIFAETLLDLAKKDKEIVLEAAKQDGYSLQYADESFRQDREVVMFAARDGASNYIDSSFKNDQEGILSRKRSHLVKKDTLFRIAKKLSLSDLINIGEGEKKSGGKNSSSILSDALEAIIGVVFLIDGYDAAKEFILKVPNSSARMDIKVGNEINVGWNSQDARALDPK